MKLLIAGSRNFHDKQFIKIKLLSDYDVKNIKEIISGGATGVDTIAEELAAELGIPFTKVPADWETYGKAAGPIRNETMASFCDTAMIFWDGTSRGTRNMMTEMEKANKPYDLYNVKREQ